MGPIGICRLATSAAICMLLMVTGCADSIPLALKFTTQETTTYRLTRQNNRSLKWEGPAASQPKGFTGGHSGNQLEMIFTQKIQHVDDKGNAVAQIIIIGLKCVTKVKDKITLDFDSSREEDLNSPLSQLIGQHYTVELTPSGDVSKVIDAEEARSAVEGASLAHRIATNLLSEEVIKDRHAISAMPDVNDCSLHIGESWSRVKDFSFDLMGTKSYEKIYTLEDVRDSFYAKFMRILRKDRRDHRIATAFMEAVPSVENAKERYKEQGISGFSQMFDSTERFTGELKLDLTDGKVVKCCEELLIEWFTVIPNPDDEERPPALQMTATRISNIEKMN